MAGAKSPMVPRLHADPWACSADKDAANLICGLVRLPSGVKRVLVDFVAQRALRSLAVAAEIFMRRRDEIARAIARWSGFHSN